MDNKEYIDQIIDKIKPLNPYKIILFGSQAQDNQRADSDIDLLVITNDEFIPENFREKMEIHLKVANRLNEIRKKVAIDLMVYTRAMFDRFIELDSMFCREIMQKGVVLYESRDESLV